MEIRLSRREIRRLCRAVLGQAEAEATAGNTASQFNAFLDLASLEVHGLGPWLSAEGRVTVDLGQEQYRIPYPTDADVGSVLGVSLWEPGFAEYRPLEQRPLPEWTDSDQQEAEGGAAYDAVQGTPAYWNQRGTWIYVLPVNDSTARKIRIRFNLRKRFADDDSVSSVDALAIQYKALSHYLTSVSDHDGAKKWETEFGRRIGALRAWQNTGHAVDLDASASFDDVPDPHRPIANHDLGTVVRP